MESWKKYQKQNKTNTHVQRLGQIVFALVILLILLSLARGLFWFFSGSNRNTYSYFESVSWKGNNQLNVLVGSKMLIGLDATLQEVKVVYLDESLHKDEIKLFNKQNFIILDAYVSNDSDVETLEEAKSYVRKAIVNDEYNTNLTRYQLYRVWRYLSSDNNTQNDQSSIMLPESIIRQEGLKIRVLNGTTIPGLATEQSFWVENLGASVIEVSNADQTFEKSRVIAYIQDDDYQTLRRLEQIFNTEVDYKPSDEPQRVDVDVIIGKDVLLK